MSKILELRTKRNTLWEQTKDFLEKNRGENGLVKAEAVEQYNKMAQEVKDLGAEIERLEQQAQIEAQLSAPTSSPVHADPKNGAKKDVKPTATAEYAENFWNMIRNRGHYGEVRNALSVGEDTEGGFTVPDEFEKKLVEALEENNIFRGLATVIRTSSGTRKIPIAEDTGEASWIDEGEEIPESDTTFGQTMLSAYKLGTMIKISNELLNDSAFDLATYIARRFGVRMGNAEERAFITGDGVGKPLGLLAETGGAKVGVTAAQKDAVTFDEIFKLYYSAEGFRAWQRAAAGAEGSTGTAGCCGRICLNDQGGKRMDVTEEVTAILRAEAHHPPCVLESAGFCTEHSANARSIGYEEERSPTLRAGVVPAAIALENHPTDGRGRSQRTARYRC